MNKEEFEIFFWGVRGSCPTIDQRMAEFGGNTSCVQMQVKDRLLIFDAGTGIQQLGRHLMNQKKPIKGDIFITHSHWDHIQGLPFFLPFFSENNMFNIYGQRKRETSFNDVIKGIMKHPYSPILWDDMDASFDFIEIKNKDIINLGDGITIKTLQTDHPDGCLVYRVEYNEKSCCYVTDLEHSEDIDLKLKDFVMDADILIYDSNYTDEEYCGKHSISSKKGWGHSTWQKGVKLAKDAKVKKLILFHHNLDRTDNELKGIESQANQLHDDVVAAKEGMQISI